MARGGTAQLIKLGLLGAGALYAVGESKKYGGIGPWLNQLVGSITSGVGATAGAAGTTAAGAVTGQAPAAASGSQPGGLVASGVYQGNAAQITAAAQAAGVTSAADPRADQYGAALWSLRSGNPMSAFAQLPMSDRATWDSVAVRGS